MRTKPPQVPVRPKGFHPAGRGASRKQLTIDRLLAILVVFAALVASSVLGVRAVVRDATGSAGTSSSASTPSSPSASVPLAFDRLNVRSHPSGAALRIRSADGRTTTGTTPFKGKVREGSLTLALSLHGYNPLTERVELDHNRSLELWLDPAGLLHHELGEFDTGPAPKQVAFTPDGAQIWVTDLGGDGVEVFDAASYRKIGDVDLDGKGAVEVIFTKDGSTAYVSQMNTNSVFEIDAATRTVRRQMFTKGALSKVMALSPDEKTLFVSNWVSDDVSEIDLKTGQVRRLLKSVDTPRGLYVTADGKRLFVAGFGNGDIQRFDLATERSKILLHTGGAMRHLVGDPARGRLYADDMAGDAVYVVDLATERVRKLASTDHNPNTIDVTPDGKVLYVSNRGKNNPVSYYRPGPEWGSVLAIDTDTGKILDAIVGGNQTTGLDVAPDGHTLAFSDLLDNRVTLFSIPPYETLAAGHGGRAHAHLADLAKD